MKHHNSFSVIKFLCLAVFLTVTPVLTCYAEDTPPVFFTNMDPSAAPESIQSDTQEKRKIKVVRFPVKVKVKTGSLDPEVQKTTTEQPKKVQQQDHHSTNAPAPARRPDIQTASPEFVEKARKTMVDTYTVVKRDGSPMPAMPQRKVTSENIGPMRLSVADIAHDPLASQIVNLSPEELALAMSGIKPSSGIAAKPRIVRQEGERIYRSKRSSKDLSGLIPSTTTIAPTPSIAPVASVIPVAVTTRIKKNQDDAPQPVTTNMPRFTFSFEPGETNLSVGNEAQLDKALVESLKNKSRDRLQIVSWASPTDGKETSARRTALARALSIRAYLISKGIDAARMDVRAMGIQTDSKAAADQVDMILIPEKS